MLSTIPLKRQKVDTITERWTTSTGMSGQLQTEQVDKFQRNTQQDNVLVNKAVTADKALQICDLKS
jgi:hypothetical protein